MTNEELNTALYKKVFAEQEKYREWLLSQPPDEILNHCYEYTVREDIVLALEEYDLSDKQCKALLKSPSPLADVFKDFEKRETDHMDNIRDTMDNKLLFESADYHNAMFVGYDKDGKARYGALRSTVSSYKGELTGSDKHFSFFLEGKPNAEHIHVFESAIDLLSFATLTLLAGRDWKSETYLSLAGVFQTKRENVVPVALSRFLDEHPSVCKIHLHLDNDAVGRGAVKGIVGGLQGRYQVYDEPPSRGKDVNDELKICVGLMRERKERERT